VVFTRVFNENRISFNKIKPICNSCNLGCAEAGRILLCGIRRACPAPDAVGPGGTRSYPFTSFQGKGMSSASSRIQDPMHLRQFKIQGNLMWNPVHICIFEVKKYKIEKNAYKFFW
jgi:hypothetical protein